LSHRRYKAKSENGEKSGFGLERGMIRRGEKWGILARGEKCPIQYHTHQTITRTRRTIKKGSPRWMCKGMGKNARGKGRDLREKRCRKAQSGPWEKKQQVKKRGGSKGQQEGLRNERGGTEKKFIKGKGDNLRCCARERNTILHLPWG